MTVQSNTTRSLFSRLHIEQRIEQPRWLIWLSPVILVVAALLIGAILLQLAGANPWLVYYRMAEIAFGDLYGLSDTTIKATPLILAGLGVSLAFRMKLWNIGAEGQLFLGAFMASGVALHWLPAETPKVILLTAMALAAAVGGALWGVIPGLLKAKLNVNEIITSLMLNYVAIQWNNFFVYGPWSQGGFGLTPTFEKNAWLPRFADYAKSIPAFQGITAHVGIFLAIILAIILWIVFRRSKWGFEINIIGDNPRAAYYAGINLSRNTMLIMALSGALAGLAGFSEISGVVHRLQERFSPGYGFTAIIVAWLARLNPLTIILVAYLFGGLLVGGDAIQPMGVAQMLQGVILFVVIGGELLLTYRIRFER